MGLDITAYRNLKVEYGHSRNDDGEFFNINTGEVMDWDLPFISLYQNSTPFLSRGGSIESNVVYSHDPDTIRFRAGSYGGYNHWRNILCFKAHGITDREFWNKVDSNTSFYELIDFTDCDGFIGAEVCAKLYDDFVQNEERIKATCNEDNEGDEWFMYIYDEFMNAFKFASENGVVVFH